MKNLNRFPPIPEPPDDLQAPGKALWTGILRDHVIDDAAGLSLLHSAARAEDDIVKMRQIVRGEGFEVRDRFDQPQPHPLLAAIRGSEEIKRASLRGLNLDVAPLQPGPGRPSGR